MRARQAARGPGDGERHQDRRERAEEIHEQHLVDVRQALDRQQQEVHAARIRTPRRIDLAALLEQLHE